MPQKPIEDNIMLLPKETLNVLLFNFNPDELYLFLFLYNTARWDKNNKHFLTITRIAKLISWEKNKVEAIIKKLKFYNFVEIESGYIIILFINIYIYPHGCDSHKFCRLQDSAVPTILSSDSEDTSIIKKIPESKEPAKTPDSLQKLETEENSDISSSAVKPAKIGNSSQNLGNDDSLQNLGNENKEKKEENQQENTKVKPIKSQSKKDVFDHDSIEYLLTQTLYNNIIERRPNYFGQSNSQADIEKRLQKWCRDMHLILNKDKRDPEQVLDIIDWTNRNDFWCRNINSTSKLREQYSRLLDQMELENPKKEVIEDSFSHITNPLIRDFENMFLNGQHKIWADRDIKKFIEAAKKIHSFHLQSYISIEDIKRYMLQCIKKRFTDEGKIVYIGCLYSDNTWNILLPQYLSELGINY